MSPSSPLRRLIDPDAQWFADHADRKAHIREPRRELIVDKQRATRFADECEAEFRTLGDHKKDRRRVIVYRVPPNNPAYRADRAPLMKIPFLLYADETVEDRDDILLPIVDEIMMDAARQHGLIPNFSTSRQ